MPLRSRFRRPRRRPAEFRRWSWKRFRGAATGLAVALVQVAAAAQGDRSFADQDGAIEPIVIEYDADSECPSADDFRRLVFERTASARLADGSEPARIFRAELRKSGRRFVGSLVIIEPDGASVARRVNGKRCDEVATVLALASALAIDPHAKLAPGETLEEQGEPEEPGPEPVPLPPEKFERPDWNIQDPPSPPLEWKFGVALGPRMAFGDGPETALGGGVLLASYFGRDAALGSLGVELAAMATVPHDVSGASASFQFFVARPQACPVAFATGSIGGLAPCAAIELGFVNAQVSDLPSSEASLRFWSAFELALRWDVALGETWFLQAEGAVQLPLSRYEFVIDDPQTLVHSVPAVTGAGTLRVGLRR